MINFPRVACGDVRKRTVCKIFLDRTPRKHGINTSSAVIESARRGAGTSCVVVTLDVTVPGGDSRGPSEVENLTEFDGI